MYSHPFFTTVKNCNRTLHNFDAMVPLFATDIYELPSKLENVESTSSTLYFTIIPYDILYPVRIKITFNFIDEDNLVSIRAYYEIIEDENKFSREVYDLTKSYFSKSLALFIRDAEYRYNDADYFMN